MGGEKIEAPEEGTLDEARAEQGEGQTRVQELLTRLKYLQADLENSQKRAEKERSEYTRYANALLISHLLPILDQFDLALRPPSDAGKDFVEGMRMIRDNLLEVLRSEGLEEIPVDGAFDPYIHEAVGDVEAKGKDEGTIVEVVRRGYRLGPRVLRPAQVVVARAAAGGGKAEVRGNEDR
jgi:molecular chaperone GrpE